MSDGDIELSDFGPGRTEASACTSCSCAGWSIGFFLVLILFLVALGILIWLLVRDRNKKGNLITFINPRILVPSDTSIQGVWDSTGSSSDTVTLYVSVSPLDITGDGVVSSPTITPQKATSGATSVTITGLSPHTKYYAVLIANNTSSTTNFQTYTQIVFTAENPTTVAVNSSAMTLANNIFTIENILQVGKVYLTSSVDDVITGGTGPISFEQALGPTGLSSLWFLNSNNQLQLDTSNVLDTGSTGICLLNQNGLLIAGYCTTADKWIYNPSPSNVGGTGSYTNQWCLSNTLQNSTPTCMQLGTISNGSASINLSNSTTPGDAWVNAYEILPQ